MTDFHIVFDKPLLLLLLIPAAFFTFFPYFRSPKKYRRTRNRIVSLVLHACITTLAVLLVVNTYFSYNVPNDKNELIILVDKSHSAREASDETDEFVKTLIDESGSGIKVGVVTFGYDCVYAAPLSENKSRTYEKYLNAEKPDETASDVASALEYAKNLISHPQNAKIVLVSDGLQTDGSAKSAVRTIAAQGTKIDVYPIKSAKIDNDKQVLSVTLPQSAPSRNVSFTSTVKTGGSFEGEGFVVMKDNGEEVARKDVLFEKGEQSFSFTHTFTRDGLHRLSFSVEADDSFGGNDEIVSYLFVEIYDDILVIEGKSGESTSYRETLEGENYNFSVVTPSSDNLPRTAEELCAYDEVVLFNVSNKELTDEFTNELEKYVSEYGGGLFTVGGNKDGSAEAKAYNRKDLAGSRLQRLLPVEAVEYTPAEGIMFIVDVSGSMTNGRVDAAVNAIRATITDKKFDKRNWVGIMTLSEGFGKVLAMTPMSQLSEIEDKLESLRNLEGEGDTIYKNAFQTAGTILAALDTVQIKHIILISDAKEGSEDNKDPLWEKENPATGEYSGGYGEVLRNNRNNGIICSIVDMSQGKGMVAEMKEAAEIGGGKYLPIDATQPADAGAKMREAVFAGLVAQENEKEFIPTVSSHTGILTGVDEKDMPSLGGYYGTKIKSGATVVLAAEHNIPVYAQWSYGKGKVGSFTSDLSGVWSSAFLRSDTGKKLLKNMTIALFPDESIKAPSITASVTGDNYRAEINLFVNKNDDDTVEILVERPDGTQEKIMPDASQGFTKATFETRQKGVYSITVTKKSPDGTEETCNLFYAFSYSKEFDNEMSENESEKLFEEITAQSDGKIITKGQEIGVFDGFVRKENRKFDPRFIFAGVALALFILDIAVRKFKFKWLHEIIGEAKEKKAEKNKGGEKA